MRSRNELPETNRRRSGDALSTHVPYRRLESDHNENFAVMGGLDGSLANRVATTGPIVSTARSVQPTYSVYATPGELIRNAFVRSTGEDSWVRRSPFPLCTPMRS